MKPSVSYMLICLLSWLSLLQALSVQAGNNDMLNRKIELTKSKGTIYELLEKITEHSGCLFIYDSRVIKNEKTVTIKKGIYTIKEAIYEITGNRRLSLRVIGNHILIELPEKKKEAPLPSIAKKDSAASSFITIEGSIFDKYANTPIPFASVGIPVEAIGAITNQDGNFRLRIPDSLKQTDIHFSHIGYIPQTIKVNTLTGRPNTLSLEPKVISLQEIIVRLINPHKVIADMLSNRDMNYAKEPVYLTSFYREGTELKKGFVNLTEAIVKIYKIPFSEYHAEQDQVKLLKMRHISNREVKDTIITKIKSGVNATLLLDLIKNPPEFLNEPYRFLYNYAHTDITMIDNRMVNVIVFEQKNDVKDPLYRGELYIDNENDALVAAHFEIHPKYVEKAVGMFIERKSRNLEVKPQKITYTVTYKPWNNTYYISHIRGDLHFRIKKKKQLFGSSNVHMWFESVTCKIDTTNVSRFARNESIQTKTIFAETDFVYDENFWGDFNIILPEEKLNESISKIASKIEEINY
ncbi:MAG: carboxypeptidase-like regulatory domain-containing protein [Tannerellaceae bacterium]|jgi:hypothetical protein|nr:carboxypeptidase-like regulatory domain-containing protein [Tannerellaceae bacterium]